MEAPAAGMEEEKKLEEAKLTSAAAFVEGGIQEACDDACSICLEDFCESDPSTVTGCKHEFHLQCILEWCQRSSQCPMCWQPISLKDPTSQELLDAVVQERNLRLNPPRNAAIFHHPTLGNFEIQHLPVGVNDAELEERIIQHLAAGAAMRRARHYARREGRHGRSSAQGRQHFLVLSSHPNSLANSSPEEGLGDSSPASFIATPSSPIRFGGEASQSPSSPNRLSRREIYSGSNAGSLSATQQSYSSPSSNGQPSARSQDRAGPSDLQSFSETLKSRLNAISMRYKESISKSTRGWKERWFSRNSGTSDVGSEVHREVNAGITTVSQMMERLEARDSERVGDGLLPNSSDSRPEADMAEHRANSAIQPGGNRLSDSSMREPCAAHSVSD